MLAHIMAQFHSTAALPDEAFIADAPQKLRSAILANFTVTEPYVGDALDPALHTALRNRAQFEFDLQLPILSRRSRTGLVVDGHGDLHARNICLDDPPVIFDCIEFNPSFRCGDVASENAFLVMDLIYRGHPELAREYLDAYIGQSGDEEQRRLMPLLVSYRAMVRSKVAALSMDDANLSEDERQHARESAVHHLQLAAAAAADYQPVLLILCGLPGSGKSYLSQALTRRAGWPVVSSDIVRKELAGVAPRPACRINIMNLNSPSAPMPKSSGEPPQTWHMGVP